MENEQVEQETIKIEKMREQLSRPEVIGSFIGMGMVGFCFGIGFVLAVKTVSNLEYCIDEIIKENQVTANKIAEENQEQQEPQQVTTKERQGKAVKAQ